MAQSSEHHITPLNTYLKVAAALFVLTFLTIGFHAIRQYLGPFAALIAFLIAGVKAFLVLAWFMHLKYDRPSNRVIFASGFFFLALLFVICVMDMYSRYQVESVL
jgi:cytochrome c oxidase subunit IV